MEYSKIKSAYIKKLILETSWANHTKIDELIKLHYYITNHPRSYNSGMHFTFLKNKYENEFLILLKEYSEMVYADEIKKRQAYQEKLIEEAKKQEIHINKLKIDWIKAGGQP